MAPTRRLAEYKIDLQLVPRMPGPYWIAAVMTTGLLGSAAVITCTSARALATEPTAAVLTPEVLAEITRLETEIDSTENQTLERIANPPATRFSKSSCSARCCTTNSSR
jgi:hypothetical protein